MVAHLPAGKTASKLQYDLDHAFPAAYQAQLGALLVAMIASHNQVQTDLNALVVKYNALLAKMDTANVTGLSNNNASTCGGVASGAAGTAPAFGSL